MRNKQKRRNLAKPEVYTVPELARIFRVSPGVIYRAIEGGFIPIIDLGDRRPLRIPALWINHQLAPDFNQYPSLRFERDDADDAPVDRANGSPSNI
jgi:hypothetical protein